MVAIDDTASSESAPTPSRRSRLLARVAVDGVLLLLGGVVLWELASRSLLLVAIAVTACLVGAATAVARFENAPRQVVAFATASSALAASILLSTTSLWSPNETVASLLLLLAAMSMTILGALRLSSNRWSWIFAIVATTLLVGPGWAVWRGDGNISISTAARLLAVSIAVAGVRWSSRQWSLLTIHLGIAVAVGAGLPRLELRVVELSAVSLVGLLTIIRWWRVSPDSTAPVASGDDRVTTESTSVTVGILGLLAIGWLCAVSGAWKAVAVVWAGTIALTVSAVGGGLETTRERRRRVRSLERVAMEIARRSQIDALTRLPNREAFDHRLAEEIERAIRYQQPVALCFVDIDHFKAVNDAHGHADGDRVLMAVAESLRSSARTIDVVCRYGGEEFAVIAPGTWSSDAVVLADRLRARVSLLCPAELRWPLTVSVGVAGLPEHAADGESLLRRADEALYEAKRSGRDRTAIAHTGELTDRA